MTIKNTVLSTTVANIAVGSGNLGIATSTVYFCNRSVTPVTINVYAVGVGSSASADNVIYSNVSLTADETYVMDLEKIFLDPGEVLQANASAIDSVVATVSSIGL